MLESSESLDQYHLKNLISFLKFKSISADSDYHEETENCSLWLKDRLENIGLSCEIFHNPKNKNSKPIVIAKNNHKVDRKTVLIYGHYDVQPPDPLEQWDTRPFDPVIKNDVIYARGATDNKGQIYAHIAGIENWIKENKELPINLIFLIEGEEEIGSPFLEEFLKQPENKIKLKNDIVLISDTGMISEKYPTLTYSLRGIVYFDVKVKSSNTDLHSGIYGGMAPNPAYELSRLLFSLRDEDGHILIPNFYSDVKEITNWERENWQDVPFDEKELAKVIGVKNVISEKGFTSMESIWARPAFDINGLTSGYQGEGSKTIIPNQASAKFSLRLVPDQKPEKVIKQIFEFLNEKCNNDLYYISFNVGHSGKPYFFDPYSKYGQIAQKALKKLGKRYKTDKIALIREGGSIPIVQSFKDYLGSDSLLIGFALSSGNIHAPNENFPLDNFYSCISFNNLFLDEFI